MNQSRSVLQVVLVVATASTLATSCKKQAPSSTPGVDIRGLSLEEIELELDRNRLALSDAGVYVAQAEPPPTAATPSVEHEAGAVAPTEPSNMGAPDEEPDAEYEYDDVEADSAPPEPMAAPASEERAEILSGSRRRSRAERRERRKDEAERCERICELADASCELEEQICGLAERHPEEERYEQACARAGRQCEAALEACDQCE